MADHPTIDITAPNNCDGVWVRDLSALLAVEPELPAATWKIQVRTMTTDAVIVLNIPREHGSISYVDGVLLVEVPLAVMQTIAGGTYVWDGIYTIGDRVVRWAKGKFVVDQGVTR